MGKPTERASEMRRRVEEFSLSRQTRREVCRQHRIPLTTFDYWRQRLRAQPRLVKVEVARAQAASFTLRLANGRAIESSFAFGEEDLMRLIRVAERA